MRRRSEDNEALKKAALKTFLDYSIDKMDNAANSNNRAKECQSLIFGNNSFVSFVRGLDCSYDDRTDAAFHSTPHNSKCNEMPFPDSQYIESLKLTDSDFLDSETGKQLILNDQVLHETRNLQKTTCAGSSSWTPCSRKNMSSLSIECSDFKQKESISVGEFIGRFSESMSFNSVQKKQNIFAGCSTSTPKEKRKSRSMSSLLEVESNEFLNNSLSSPDFRRKESLCTILTPTSIKPLNLTTPKWKEESCTGDFRYCIGSTARKNLDRLKKEERKIRGLDGSFSFDSRDSRETEKTVTKGSGAIGFDTTTYALEKDTFVLSTDSLRPSCNTQWFLDPQTVLLDSYKGKNIRLMNNSSKILKFKTEFNSRFVNVCPLSGTVPEMSQIGLRIYISQYAKKQNTPFEEEIKVIIGKNEKIISVKFVRAEKPKLMKKRSYILY